MERAGRVIGKLKLSAQGITDEQLAISAWGSAVGKKIALRTRPSSLVRARLVIDVEDAVWQKQLFTLREQILFRLEQVIGRRVVEQLEFRVAIARRQPAMSEVNAPSPDEADAIQNPMLRQIYRASRKRATA